MRSRWKGRFFLFGHSLPLPPSVPYNYRKVYLSPSLVGQRLSVYDGRRRFLLQVRETMVPHRLSLFFPTKRWGGSIHLKGARQRNRR